MTSGSGRNTTYQRMTNASCFLDEPNLEVAWYLLNSQNSIVLINSRLGKPSEREQLREFRSQLDRLYQNKTILFIVLLK